MQSEDRSVLFLRQVGDGSQPPLTADIIVDTAYRQRVMEDLDALLADLQSTTAHISSYQSSSVSQQQQPPPPATKEAQPSAASSTILQQRQNYNDHHNSGGSSSSSSSESRVHQQQVTHSSFDSPGYKWDQASSSSTAKGEGYALQGGVTEVTVSRRSYSSSGDNSSSSTPPPLPPPPPLDDLEITEFDRDFEQPIYEQQTFHVRETTPSSTSDSSDQAVVQRANTQTKDRGERMSALSSNLSELDQLLQDLNSAQFLAEVDRKSSTVGEVTVVNGGPSKQPPPVAPKPGSKSAQRTSLDNLLDQLEEPGPQGGRKNPVDPNYQELSTVTTNHSQYHNGTPATVYRAASTSSASSTSSYYQPQSASTATKELDELMMSLSQFKSKGDSTPAGDNEPAYAKPVKSRSVSGSSPTSPHGPSLTLAQQLPPDHGKAQHQPLESQKENGLEVMLGDLQSNLNRQGVNIKQKGVCAACQKPIVGQVIAALGRTWHLEHFVCAHCEEPLGTRNFYERDSLAYCEKDYQQLFAPRCAYCNGAIVDKCITALEKMWHPEHFFCAQCGRPFGEEDFHEKNGKAYCREDYFQMFAPKCGGCAQPIMENYISALNRQWHPECFICFECRASFGAGSFFDYDGLPYCETHYHAKKGSLCASCERPITGRCITAMFRKFHPEHFVCAFCLKQLNKGTFKEQNDKPYCHPCFVKLFG